MCVWVCCSRSEEECERAGVQEQKFFSPVHAVTPSLSPSFHPNRLTAPHPDATATASKRKAKDGTRCQAVKKKRQTIRWNDEDDAKGDKDEDGGAEYQECNTHSL